MREEGDGMASGHYRALLGLIYFRSIKSKKRDGRCKQTAASQVMREIVLNRRNQEEYWVTRNEHQPDESGLV